MTNDRNAPSSTAGFLFDQWSRYSALARGIRALLPDGGTVLDVGCGEAMMLGEFLPDHEVSYLDPLLEKRHGERVRGGEVLGVPLAEHTVAAGAFDAVVAVDVLEHVPAEQRSAFVGQMVRASRRGVVLAAPFSDVGDARDTDDIVHLAYRAKHGHDYSWLHEHEEFGLPRLDALQERLQGLDLHVQSFGNGHTPWLKDLLALHVVLLDRVEHHGPLREIGNRFAAELLHYDDREPTYRRVVVASRAPLPELRAPTWDAARHAEADRAWHRFFASVAAGIGTHADELAANDADAATPTTPADAHELTFRLSQQAQQLHEANDRIAHLEQQAKAKQRAHDELLRTALFAQGSLQAVQHSLSWRVTAPVRALGRGAAFARAVPLAIARVAAKSRLADRWRWPLKSAFFAVFGPLLKGTEEYEAFQQARRWRRLNRSGTAVGEPASTISPPHATLPDVIVFGVIDWNLRIQRPQHLARELAQKGHRVLYLSPGFDLHHEPGYRTALVSESPEVHQVWLRVDRPVSIYEADLPEPAAAFLAEGLRLLLGDVGLSTNLALVDHPGWADLVRLLPRSVRVYDCMDNHQGFAESGSELPKAEARLLRCCDGVVVTSNRIADEMEPRHASVHMVRNACAPSDFRDARTDAAAAASRRPVIGYFGAIAPWFDAVLLARIADDMPDCDFVLIGDDTANVAERLQRHQNVTFTGEIGYEQLPLHLRGIDVLLIPFVIDELTLATNPVKAYEALAAGKPVVATPMPELIETDVAPFVRIGRDAAELVPALRQALADAHAPELQQRRIAYAEQQTWRHRADALIDAVAAMPKPRAAVVVVSWNDVALTSRCVRSVLDDPLAPELDVIVVDNASTDATPAWLDEIERDARVRVIRNADNRGFGKACNQGLAAGAERDPDFLVILNNDLVVTPGWTRTIHHHLCADPRIGLIGPITNNIGNEARVPTRYQGLDAMQPEQRALTGRAAGRTFEIPVLAFFCVAMPLDVYREVGGLDENFGTGFFEDDDYCQRVRRLDRRIVCAEDVFVHHELSASFAKIDQVERQRLFDQNKAYYESKWGEWQRHTYRPRQDQTDANAS